MLPAAELTSTEHQVDPTFSSRYQTQCVRRAETRKAANKTKGQTNTVIGRSMYATPGLGKKLQGQRSKREGAGNGRSKEEATRAGRRRGRREERGQRRAGGRGETRDQKQRQEI